MGTKEDRYFARRYWEWAFGDALWAVIDRLESKVVSTDYSLVFGRAEANARRFADELNSAGRER